MRLGVRWNEVFAFLGRALADRGVRGCSCFPAEGRGESTARGAECLLIFFSITGTFGGRFPTKFQPSSKSRSLETSVGWVVELTSLMEDCFLGFLGGGGSTELWRDGSFFFLRAEGSVFTEEVDVVSGECLRLLAFSFFFLGISSSASPLLCRSSVSARFFFFLERNSSSNPKGRYG